MKIHQVYVRPAGAEGDSDQQRSGSFMLLVQGNQE